jgi:Gpi18-like mannosyltransferase
MAEPARQDASGWRQTKLGQVLALGRSLPWLTAICILAGVLAAGALRVSLLDFKSVDYYSSLKPWYNTIQSQGFSAFATGFSNYNPPYLYLLYLVIRLFPDAPIVVAAKLPPLIADFICAGLLFLIVRTKTARGVLLALTAGGAALFAPTVLLNSAFWGQADSLYTAGILGWTYFMLRRRPTWAMVCFGVALAFKLQAVFLLPLVAALALKRLIPWKTSLVVPAILLLALVPVWAAGRPILDSLSIYANQTGQYESLTMNAPSAYTWLPGSKQVFNLFYLPGILMGLAVALVWCYVLYRGPRTAGGRLILELTLVTTLLVPFFLPKMHERYFYPADVLSIAFGFMYPELFFVPIIVLGTSFLSYQPFLFERELVPFPVLTLVLLVLLALLSYHSLSQLYSRTAPEVEESLGSSSKLPAEGAAS